MPPLHLYQLDQTEVASGIDTEPLWDGIWNLKRSKPYEKISEQCSRELFVNAVCRTFTTISQHYNHPMYVAYQIQTEIALFGLLEPHLSIGIVQHLKRSRSPFMYFKDFRSFVSIDIESYKEHLIHRCKPHSALDRPCSELQAFVQERVYSCRCSVHSKFFVFVARRFASVVARAGFTPTKLSINADAMVNLQLWQPGKGGLLQYFLESSKLKRIEIVCIDTPLSEPPNITLSILCTVLSSPQLCLQHLEVTTPLDGDSLASIAPALAAYGRLKFLKLVIDVCKASKSHYAVPLHSIIANQRAVECVELKDTTVWLRSGGGYKCSEVIDDTVLASLGNLFQNDDFCKLRIDGFTIPQSAVEMIMAAFFKSTPTNEQCILIFSSTKFQKSSAQPNAVSHNVDITREHAEKFGPKKRLYIQGTQFVGDPDIPTCFWRWFDSIPYIYLLELRGKCECHGTDMRSHFMKHPNFKVGYLYPNICLLSHPIII